MSDTVIDSADMTDAELDAAIMSNPSEHTEEGSNSGEGVDTSVSPLDGAEGQPAEGDSLTDVDQNDELDADPEGSLSTDDDGVEGNDDEPGEGDEPLEGKSDADPEPTLDADEEPIAFQPLRADGKEYPIESMQELYTLASKGINADRKWSESSEGRRIQQTMAKNNLTIEDINTLIEMKGGSKDAFMSMLKDSDVNPLDMDADAFNGYTPKDHSTGDFEMALDDVVGRIKTQPRYEETVNVIMEQWDTKSREAFYQDPGMMEALNVDMQVDPKTGFSMYDKVAPLAAKLKALGHGNKTDLEYYMEAGEKVIGGIQKQETAKSAAAEADKTKKASEKIARTKKKKAAASSGGQTAGQKPVDVSELSDEELDALLA